jgi:hypothetical protein
MPDELVSRSWRRFLRFSVRGIIVIVLLAWIPTGKKTANRTTGLSAYFSL